MNKEEREKLNREQEAREREAFEQWEKRNREAIESVRETSAAILKEFHDEALANSILQLAQNEIEKEKALMPHIAKELKKGKKDPELLNYTVFDILEAQNEERAAALDATSRTPEEIPQPKSRAVILLERARESLKAENEYKDALRPYVLEEIKALKNNAAYGLSIDDILALYSKCEGSIAKIEEEIQEGNIAAPVLKKAINAKKKAEKQARAEEARKAQRKEASKKAGSIPGAIHYAARNDEIQLLTTKAARDLFDPMPAFNTDENGNYIIKPDNDGNKWLTGRIDYSARGKQDAFVTVAFSPNYLDLDIYGYDFFLMSLLDHLLLEGNYEVTLTHILKRLGISPSGSELEKLYKHLILGSRISTIFDNRDLAEKWNVEDPEYKKITRQLYNIAIEESRRKIDGNIARLTVKIFALSPFYSVGAPLNQFSNWNDNLLQLYSGKRTPKYWRLMRYLIREIGYMRSGGRSNTTLDIKKIYQYVGDANGHDYKSTRDTVYKILEECFGGCKYIDYLKTTTDNKTGNITLSLIDDARRKKLLAAGKDVK